VPLDNADGVAEIRGNLLDTAALAQPKIDRRVAKTM